MEQYTFRQYALAYAKMGMAVFPLIPRTKKPATVRGFHDATTNFKQVDKWWKENPDYNIGIATGQPSGGLVVVDLDIDETEDKNGLETLKDWEREHGALPDTCQSITGRGGNHLLYRSSQVVKCRNGLLDGIDIKADGGYIVAPPSIHENGRCYEWEQDPEEFVIHEADEQVMKLIQTGADREERFQVPQRIGTATRNNTLFKMACSLQAKGFSDETIHIAVEHENRLRCDEPLEDKEVKQLVNSALRYTKGGSRWKQNRLKELRQQEQKLQKLISQQSS